MTAYIVKKVLKLRPLAIHLDNGWNTDLAVTNIENIVKKLRIDFFTYVLDWEEFKDLQISFLKASVTNLEMPTDHAITALLIKTAIKHNLKYIVLGGNIVTESIMPQAWRGHDNRDWENIKAIHKNYGKRKLKTFVHLNFYQWAYYTLIRGVRFLNILNYYPYNKEEAKNTLRNELDWRPYDSKHHESAYTRFFQSYYLPKKFKIDKRRAYLSTLVCSNQITRNEAIERINLEIVKKEVISEDKYYVIKKFGLSDLEFSEIMNRDPKSHLAYPHSSFLVNKNSLYHFAKKIITLN